MPGSFAFHFQSRPQHPRVATRGNYTQGWAAIFRCGEESKMVLILTEPLGLHSSPVREEREVVIPAAPRHTHTHTLLALEQVKEMRLQAGTGFCRMMSAVDKPSLTEQRRVGTAIWGAPPTTSSCLSALTETMNSPTGTPRRTVVPVGTALAVRDSGWMKHQTPTAWLFQSRAWHGKRVRACVLSSSGASNSLPPRGL